MNYKDILKATEQYGSKPRNICHLAFQCEPEQIHEKVILAPVWRPEIFSDHVDKIENIHKEETRAWGGYQIFNLKVGKEVLSYIITGIGAPNVIDCVLALPTTPCKEILFIGAVGALTERYSIGDFVIPEKSISGDGACRYLTTDRVADKDCFGESYEPDKHLTDRLCQVTEKILSDSDTTIRWHRGKNFSIDTIMAQFLHIEEILATGSRSIEMETAALFKAAKVAALSATALFLVSDNVQLNKSLLAGRSTEDLRRYREIARVKLLPKIVLETLCQR